MNSYKGPIRRKIKKYQGTNDFVVDGTVNHLESRNAFVKQTFILKQIHDGSNHYGHIAQEWVYAEEEKEFGFESGGLVPFTGIHNISDRFFLNKSIKNLSFQPYQSVNYLEIDNESKVRMLPLLCSDRTFRNVTRKPEISHVSLKIQPSVFVQMGAYGRFWFGGFDDLTNVGGVANRIGEAPYFVVNKAADATYDNVVPSVWGFLPQNLGAGQALRKSDKMRFLGQKEEDSFCGQIEFVYNAEKDIYESKEFEIHIPYKLQEQCMFHSHTAADNHTEKLHITVPSMKTRNSKDSPFNYFFINEQDDLPRSRFPTPAEIAPGGTISETLNTQDFVKVRLGSFNDVIRDPSDYNVAAGYAQANQIKRSFHEIHMFVPAFRIVKGHKYRSISRPKRYNTVVAAPEANVLAQQFNQHNKFLLPNVFSANQALVLGQQIPYWADYYTEQRCVTQDEQGGDDDLFEYIKIGYIKTEDITVDGDDPHPMLLIRFAAEDTMAGEKYAGIRAMINHILELARRPEADRPDPRVDVAEFFVLVNGPFENADTGAPEKRAATHTSLKALRLKMKYINAFYKGIYAPHAPYNDYGGHMVIDNLKETFSNNRIVQIEIAHNNDIVPHSLFRENLNIFKNPHTLDTFKQLLTVANGMGAAAATLEQIRWIRDLQRFGSEMHNENQFAKPFTHRSVFEFADTVEGKEDETVPNGGVHVPPGQFLPSRVVDGMDPLADVNYALPKVLFPQPVPGVIPGSLGDDAFEIYKSRVIEIYMPVRKEQELNIALPKEVFVECVEPFVGYGSGEHILQAKRPLDCRYDKNFSLAIQDYSYHFTRDGSELLKNGYKNDPHTVLQISAMTAPEFTTVSDKLPGVLQENKGVTDIRELSSHIEKHQVIFNDTPAYVEFEVRSGMFEFLFLWVEFTHKSTVQYYPDSDPVIEGIEIKIRGRDNLFIKSIGKHDLAQLSRDNSHSECEWRELHENGQGIMLHLADLGLTESIVYGARERIVFKISLTQLGMPDGTDETLQFLNNPEMVFKTALVRKNQAFRGDVNSCRFEYLNEI
jgi:hypothetical protein